MRHRLPTLAACAILLAVALCLPSVAAAREFSGPIVSVSGSRLVVDSAGDKLSFVPAANVKVSGRKSSWGELAKGDRVTVSWKLADDPHKAYTVVVHGE